LAPLSTKVPAPVFEMEPPLPETTAEIVSSAVAWLESAMLNSRALLPRASFPASVEPSGLPVAT